MQYATANTSSRTIGSIDSPGKHRELDKSIESPNCWDNVLLHQTGVVGFIRMNVTSLEESINPTEVGTGAGNAVSVHYSAQTLPVFKCMYTIKCAARRHTLDLQ